MEITNLTIGQIFSAVIIVSTVITTLVAIVSKYNKWFTTLYNSKKDRDDFKCTVEQHTKDIDNLNGKMDKLFDVIEKQEVQNQKVDTALLRNMIIKEYKIHKDDKTISALEYENMNEMFLQYFARGGNHLISKLFEDFKEWKVNVSDNEL